MKWFYLIIPFFLSSTVLAQNFENNLDFTQETVSRNLYNVTNRIDTYFGEDLPLDQKNGSNIKFEYAATSRENTEPTIEPNIDIKVRFRQLEKKFQFNFSSINPDEDVSTEGQQVITSANEERTLENAIYRASIGFLREQGRIWSFSFDTGIKIEADPKAFAKTRGKRSFFFGETELRMINRTYIEDRIGVFNYTDVNVLRRLSRDFTFTYTNNFNWKDSENELSTTHGPTILQTLSDKDNISYNIRTNFNNRPNYAITGHEVFSVYRRSLYKAWIFMDLIPGVSFRSKDDFERSGFFTVKLQALFGDF